VSKVPVKYSSYRRRNAQVLESTKKLVVTMFLSSSVCDAAIKSVLDFDFEEPGPEATMLDRSNEVFAELVLESKSTKKGYSVGESAFNAFAFLQGIPRLQDLTDADLAVGPNNEVVRAFRSFATYLMDTTNKEGKHFRPFSQVQYLSNVKNALAKKFPTADLLKADTVESQWYTALLHALTSRGRAEAIKGRISVIEHRVFDELF
jgi:hypothetical protein